jgi:hypothetical protein
MQANTLSAVAQAANDVIAKHLMPFLRHHRPFLTTLYALFQILHALSQTFGAVLKTGRAPQIRASAQACRGIATTQRPIVKFLAFLMLTNTDPFAA